ncbi:hypothetical protein FOZ62_027086 [Perkinsus olseni]|uniref:3'-5' exonuclease domain-containing protein n=1 Tax=Perkinsus olseni TaxID=32597 RepID=A0A7J6NCY9_PEROL|nr:hypothetical protein FOZ62_027086 [Perkinsus olseni]
MHDEARDRGLQRYGLKGMCEDCGYAIYKPKNPNFFYWSRNFLKKSQIRYAAADAWFPLLVAGYWDVLDVDVDEMEDYVSHFWVGSHLVVVLFPSLAMATDTYAGEIHIIDGPDDDYYLCRDTLFREPLGIDFEWNREFKGQNNQIALIQIATPTNGVLLFRCTPGEGLHPVARDALTCPNGKKAVCGFDSRDKKKLREAFGIEIPPQSLVDVSKVAQRRGMHKTGLKAICRELGYNIFKPNYPNFHQWSGRLRKSQIRYAASDAWFPLLIAAEWGLMDIVLYCPESFPKDPNGVEVGSFLKVFTKSRRQSRGLVYARLVPSENGFM